MPHLLTNRLMLQPFQLFSWKRISATETINALSLNGLRNIIWNVYVDKVLEGWTDDTEINNQD